MVTLPFFATNGAIIASYNGERYEVNTEQVKVMVDWHYLLGWTADVPPNWLHTDDEAKAVKDQAVEAVREFQRKRKEEKDAHRQ